MKKMRKKRSERAQLFALLEVAEEMGSTVQFDWEHCTVRLGALHSTVPALEVISDGQ